MAGVNKIRHDMHQEFERKKKKKEEDPRSGPFLIYEIVDDTGIEGQKWCRCLTVEVPVTFQG
jgi:hypothetical protein